MYFLFVMYEKSDVWSGGYLYDEKLIEHLESKDIKVEIIKMQDHSYLENIEHNFSDDLLDRLSDDKADVIVQDELCHPSLFHINDMLEVKTPIVSVVHHLSHMAERDKERAEMYRYFESEYLKTVDGVICNSEGTKDTVKDLADLEKTTTAFPGKDHIDKDFISQDITQDIKSLDQGEPLKLLFVGNILPHKCIDILIEGIKDVDDVMLDIVGDKNINSDYTEKIENLVEDEGVSSKVDILGYVDQELLKNRFEEDHLLVLPSYFEGFGITIVEALRFGMPAIVTERGGPSEIITEGREGLYVKPGDPKEIEKTIRRVTDECALIEHMSKKAYERYEELPSWTKSMEKVRKFLISIAE